MSQNSNDAVEKRIKVSSGAGREPDRRKAADGKMSAGSGKTSVRKKTVTGQRVSAGRKTATGQKVSAGRDTAAGQRASAGRDTATGQRVSAERDTVMEQKTSDGRRPSSGQKASGAKKVISDQREWEEDGRRPSSRQRVPAGNKAASGRKASSGAKAAEGRRTRTGGRGEEEPHMDRREEARARRRAERERKVRKQKVIMAVSCCVILLSVICIVVFCLPSVRVSFMLFQGDRYTEKEDYVSAQSAYEKVLEIDPASVRAYYGLADIYGKQDMIEQEEQILYTGWEQTQNEDLLHYYSVAVLNQAVADINSGNCTLSTVEKCIRALEQGTEDAKALEILDVCHDRLFKTAEDENTCMMFFDEDTAQDTCSYNEYEQLLRRLLAVYQTKASEEIKQILKQYAVIDMSYVRLSLSHLDAYLAVLTEINNAAGDTDITETMACLARAKEVRDYFNTAFDEFASGNYAYARELVSDESYQQIRDAFIEENSGYWEGSTYIPVNREQLVLHRENGSVHFSFLDSDEYENRQGIIRVWGTKQEDDGVQRSGISYEPVEEAGSESNTEYTVQYLYSNVKINGKYVPQMNYRFDTRTTTPEGVTTNAIGDWGGENEWEIDY